jgi:putative acyl-CoA dehydrogenase
MSATHEVRNQVPELVGHNPADDQALLEGLHREGAGWAEGSVRALGEAVGDARVQHWARQANDNPPVLHTHDRYGHRLDEVEFHPAWHNLMRLSVGAGLTGEPWRTDQLDGAVAQPVAQPVARPGAHVARAAKHYLVTQVEAGHTCPVDMTYSVVPVLRKAPDLAELYEPLLGSTQYDPDHAPALSKKGILAGMSLTEKQGGSDLREVSSHALPSGDGNYLLTGHKWFTSAPMNDIFLVLAQSPDGPTCFLMPRILPDGSRNNVRLIRLKNKLGNRSNASAELEYDQAVVRPIGEPGHGIGAMMEMVAVTRLILINSSAASMRAGLTQAIHHASHRSAFGRSLIEQPLMRNVLADLAVESEAALALSLRMAAAEDRAQAGDQREAALRRIGVAVGKYWVCKRAPMHAAEALECLGGNGYVEDSGLPRLYREAPLNSVWEGSGNVAALDVLRVLQREPEAVEVLLAEVDAAHGADHQLDNFVKRLRADLADGTELESRARHLAENLALALQGALLVRHSHPSVADAFCASRLDHRHGHSLGTLPTGLALSAVVERARIKTP